jgi:hypothetical protein
MTEKSHLLLSSWHKPQGRPEGWAPGAQGTAAHEQLLKITKSRLLGPEHCANCTHVLGRTTHMPRGTYVLCICYRWTQVLAVVVSG